MNCERLAIGIPNIGDTAARSDTKRSLMSPDRKDAARSCVNYYELHARLEERVRYFMQSPNVGKRKSYEPPILRKLTREQAILFLVGHAYIGDQGAKELMDRLFPTPDGVQNRENP